MDRAHGETDEILLTLDRIEAMNAGTRKDARPRPVRGSSTERRAILYHSPTGKPLERPVRVLAIPCPAHDRLNARPPYAKPSAARSPISGAFTSATCYAVNTAPARSTVSKREYALDLVPGSPDVLDAVTVRRARFRIVPTREMGIKESATYGRGTCGISACSESGGLYGCTLVADGAFLFVLSDEGWAGWMPGDIAFGDGNSMSRFARPARFAVCAGDRVPFYCDRDCRFVSGWLSMGDRIPLASTGDPRRVSVPMRRSDGRLEAGTAWLASDADVHVGYLPYTRRNVVETAFKLLDNPYDWTGAWLGRSHETTWRDIFACFGFRLPYQGELFTHFGVCAEVLPVDMAKEEKHAKILAHEPFVTLMVSWEHVQLLLGGYEGNPIVFDNHGYEYRADDGSLIEIKRTCVGDTRQPWYFYDHPVTFLELK